ncbi:MAG: hypothetical protein ACLU3I_00260 [Acutalibacteraceae bacterium]
MTTATSVEICATYDPDSRGGDPADGRKVKGATIHWVDAATAVDAEVRLYGNLFCRRRSPDGRGQELPRLPEPRFPAGPHRLQGRSRARRRGEEV